MNAQKIEGFESVGLSSADMNTRGKGYGLKKWRRIKREDNNGKEGDVRDFDDSGLTMKLSFCRGIDFDKGDDWSNKSLTADSFIIKHDKRRKMKNLSGNSLPALFGVLVNGGTETLPGYDKQKSIKEEKQEVVKFKETANREVETEDDIVFKRRIEAEIEYFVISRMIQTLWVAALNQQMNLASKQAKLLNQLTDMDKMSVKLEKEEEKRVLHYTSFFLIVLLVLFIGVFIHMLSPNYTGLVPT